MSLIPIDRDPSRTNLRVFALLWLITGAIVAVSLWRRTGSVKTAAAVALVAVAVPLAGELAPTLVRWLYVGLSVALWPVGWVVSHTLLALVYFLLLTPLGWALRLAGRTPQDHHPDPERTSYWSPRRAGDDPKRYFRQY